MLSFPSFSCMNLYSQFHNDCRFFSEKRNCICNKRCKKLSNRCVSVTGSSLEFFFGLKKNDNHYEIESTCINILHSSSINFMCICLFQAFHVWISIYMQAHCATALTHTPRAVRSRVYCIYMYICTCMLYHPHAVQA
jgi:hypothetical protein